MFTNKAITIIIMIIMIKIIANLCYVTHVGGLPLFLTMMYLKLINVLGVKKRKFMFKE